MGKVLKISPRAVETPALADKSPAELLARTESVRKRRIRPLPRGM